MIRFTQLPVEEMDRPYVKVHGKWLYLYRALDSSGNTLNFLLYATRSRRPAKRFFRKVRVGKDRLEERTIHTCNTYEHHQFRQNRVALYAPALSRPIKAQVSTYELTGT